MIPISPAPLCLQYIPGTGLEIPPAASMSVLLYNLTTSWHFIGFDTYLQDINMLEQSKCNPRVSTRTIYALINAFSVFIRAYMYQA